jgi:prepilin-type N-terminal cleavage/methylation domain-containing protein
MNAHRGTAGFTLIELLVGLAVASIALVAGFSALGMVHERGLAAENVNREALSGATQRALLTDWLSSARYQTAGVRFEGLDAEAGALPADEVIFPTTARTPLNELTTTVRLFVDTDDQTPDVGLMAELASANLAAAPRLMSIAPSVVSMEIKYLPEADGTADWVDGWIGRESLPRGMEIRLTAAAGDSLPPLLRLPIRAALPSLR